MKKSAKITYLIAASCLLAGVCADFGNEPVSIKADDAATENIVIDQLSMTYDSSNSCWYLWVISTNTDWPDLDKMGDANYYNVDITGDYYNTMNIWDYCYINGVSITAGGYWNGDFKIDKWCRNDRCSFAIHNLPETIESVTFKAGCLFPSYQTAKGGATLNYTVAEDITYKANVVSSEEYSFSKSISVTEVDDAISTVTVTPGYNTSMTFLLLGLETNDYNQVTENSGNDYPVHSASVGYLGFSNYPYKVLYNGTAMDLRAGSTYLNYKANYGSVGIDATSYLGNVQDGDTITIPAGTTFPSYGILKETSDVVYKTKEDVTFVRTNGSFRKQVVTTTEDTSVTGLNLTTGFDETSKFLSVMLSNSDYDNDVLFSEAYNMGNDYDISLAKISYKDCCNFGYSMELNGEPINIESRSIYINYRLNYGGIGFNFNSEYLSLKNFDTFTIKAGTTFPSFFFTIGQSSLLYKTTEDVTFTYYNGEFHTHHAAEDAEWQSDETGHWKACEVCGTALEKHEHTVVTDYKAPSCMESGYEECQYCFECGYVLVEGAAIPATGHDYENAEWHYDEEGHWRNCTACGETSDKETHVYGEDGRTCEVCGYKKNVVFLTIINGYCASTESREFAPGTELTIIANEPEEGMEFSAWYIDEEIVSTDICFNFVIEHDTTLEARYVAASTVVPDEPGDDSGSGSSSGTETKKSGCKGSVAVTSALLSMTALAGAILAADRKRRK